MVAGIVPPGAWGPLLALSETGADEVGLAAADADGELTPQSGRPTTVVGQLPMGPLPEGPFTLFIEVYGGPGNKKLLAGHRVVGERATAEYAPAGAAVPR